jgi:hypothetical protein
MFWNDYKARRLPSTSAPGAHNAPLDAFLTNANDAVRQVFKRKVTYASVPAETVDWSRFDIIASDLYRDARVKHRCADLLRRPLAYDRPVVGSRSHTR